MFLFFVTGRDGKLKLSQRDGTVNKSYHEGRNVKIFFSRRDGTVLFFFSTGRYTQLNDYNTAVYFLLGRQLRCCPRSLDYRFVLFPKKSTGKLGNSIPSATACIVRSVGFRAR